MKQAAWANPATGRLVRSGAAGFYCYVGGWNQSRYTGYWCGLAANEQMAKRWVNGEPACIIQVQAAPLSAGLCWNEPSNN